MPPSGGALPPPPATALRPTALFIFSSHPKHNTALNSPDSVFFIDRFCCFQDQCVIVMYSNVGGVIAHQSTYVRGKKKEVRDASKEELSKEASRESVPITTRLLSFIRRRINPPPGKPSLITFTCGKFVIRAQWLFRRVLVLSFYVSL